MLSVITLNTFLLDVRLFGLIPLFRRAPHIPARLDALIHALGAEKADILCLQEVFRRPHRQALVSALSREYPHQAGLDHPGRPLGTGLMIFSRHPLSGIAFHEFRAAHGEERLITRHGALSCFVETPQGRRIGLINTHLTAGGLFRHPEDKRAEALRRRQIAELCLIADGLSHAADKPQGAGCVLLAGDFNAGPESSVENYRDLLARGWRDIFHEARGTRGTGEGPAITWDPANPVIWSGRNKALPPQRIDHVLYRSPAAEDGLRPLSGEVIFHENRVLPPGGLPIPLSDHYGLKVVFSAGGQEQ